MKIIKTVQRHRTLVIATFNTKSVALTIRQWLAPNWLLRYWMLLYLIHLFNISQTLRFFRASRIEWKKLSFAIIRFIWTCYVFHYVFLYGLLFEYNDQKRQRSKYWWMNECWVWECIRTNFMVVTLLVVGSFSLNPLITYQTPLRGPTVSWIFCSEAVKNRAFYK